MKTPSLLSIGALISLFTLPCILAEENSEDDKELLFAMVTEAKKDGMYQLVEVLDSNGNKNVGEPGEKVRIKFTTVNLTERALMVARDYITPQHGSIYVRSD